MFLLRRNLPLAWAGWYDDFTAYGVGTIRQPWVHLADGTPASFTGSQLVIPANYSHTQGGGESYEFQPFTPNWGLEFELWFPVEGLLAQNFGVFFTDSWAKIGGSFQNMVGFRLMHTTAQDNIQFGQFPGILGGPSGFRDWASPIGAYLGQWVTVRIWIENDEWVRLWLNNVYVGSTTITGDYKTGPTRRCIRFLNEALCTATFNWIDHYDRTPTLPPSTVWSPVFYDDFNRTNGAPGNGWTQFGSAGQIANNSYSPTGTTDHSSGILRDTGNGSGKVRIEATYGGNTGPNSEADSSLILCSNAAGTQALAANVFSNRLYISNLSGSLTSPTMTDQQAMTTGVSVASGDKVAFSIHNTTGWVEINGVPRLYAGSIHDAVPASNTYAGLRVERAPFNNSASWNDVRIFSGV